jgi:hypothetical protein
MSERGQNQGNVFGCDDWESLLADAMDGALSAADQAAFDRHASECALCAQMLKETEQGRDWMKYLAEEPEVPAGLLEKILTRTNQGPEAGAAAPAMSLPPRPAWRRVFLPAVRQVVEPRLLMTAAMAFFSIALTLNLSGIRLTQLRAQDFQPSRMKATLTRQFYSTNAQVTKYYENLRLVYEMESRVRELRRTTEPAATPQDSPKRPTGEGTPSSKAPRAEPDDRQTGSRERMTLPEEIVPVRLDRNRKNRMNEERSQAWLSPAADPGQRTWV